MQAIIWLFPILFMFHDFEEIIFVQAWIRKNKSFLYNKFPRLTKKLSSHFDNITTAAFALGVAEEFILISIITVTAYITNRYNLWTGLFIAFTIHLLIHCIQALIIRRYIPTVITSIICLPFCIYIIKKVVEILPLNIIILYSILGFVIMVINLVFIHKIMVIFDQWLIQYERK